jgi:hypothetical protein
MNFAWATKMIKIKLKYFLPLIVMQAYLITTLIIFQFGPIDYNIQSPILFWSLMFIYQFSLFLGYYFACSFKVGSVIKFNVPSINSILGLKWFYIILILASLNLILVHGSFFIEFIGDPNLSQKITDAVLKSGENYSDKMESVSIGSGNKIFNIFLFFIAFSQIFIIPLIIFNWSVINYKFKIIAILVSICPMLISLLNGQNKGLFDFFILFGVAIIIVSFYERTNQIKMQLRNPRSLYILPILSLVLFLSFFGNAMSQRGGNLTYIETVDRANNIVVNKKSAQLASESFAYYTYAWLTSYVVQGYYGFSLSLEEKFDSSYGFGNSIFLTRNVESILNIDFQSKTFQRKIDSLWDEQAQWHSMYSYFANDFNFPGVSLVLFVLSFIFARVWISFLNTGNIFAGVLICIYAILIIFIPANNQIFGFLHGLSAFFWGFLFWFFSTKSCKL